MNFYCGINETRWNKHPTAPGMLACISPVYGASVRTRMENRVRVPVDTEVLQDSGAFSDGPGQRLSFAEAYERQIAHGEKYGYSDQITHRASYDLLIDEVWTDDNRYKRRWTVNDAEQAVSETIDAARFMAHHKDRPAVLSVQGVSAAQYLDCARQVVPLLEAGDVLGFGGWCITGKMRSVMMPIFRETIRLVIPWLGRVGVKRIHIWGVLYAPALGELLWMCDQQDIALSTDSSGPSWRPSFGEWGFANWKDKTYVKAPVEIRGLDRARHVEATREWLRNLRYSRYYREPPIISHQLSFDIELF